MIGNRVSTATILFTDLVASTELRASMGEVAADRFSGDHERLLAEVVERCGGRVVKGEGDGVMAAFAAASDAVQAAVEIQRAVAMQDRWGQLPGSLALRIGLGAGDVTFTDDDCRGMPVVEAARLEAAAATNEILCTDLVRLLTGGRGDHDFEPVGSMELKGIPEAVPVSRVVWMDQAGIVPPVPSPLANLSTGPFVGREAEQQVLRDAWVRANDSGTELLSLVGEPGAGKSRLAAEFATQIAERGALVLFGRCDPGAGVPYQPLAEALTPQTESDPRTAIVNRRPELARLIGAPPTDGEPGTESDSEGRRYQLFNEVTGALSQLSTAAPTLLVLDDLHWAAAPTLAMLRHIVEHEHAGRLLICATRRHTPAPSELLELEQHLARRVTTGTIELGGLDLEDITELARFAGVDTPLAERIYMLSGGSALLAGEVLRGLADGTIDTAEDLPRSVGAAVATRTARLGDKARKFLEAAAICGHRFEPWLAGSVADLQGESLLDAIDTALDERLVAEVASNPPAYEFNHALLRLALVQDLSSVRAQTLHRRAGRALIARSEARSGPTAAEAAAHLEADGAQDDWDVAARLRLVAAEYSSEQLAPEDAIVHLEAGVVDIGNSGEAELELAFELHFGLASAHAEMVDGVRSADAAVRAAEIADQMGSDHHLARAAAVNVPRRSLLDDRQSALAFSTLVDRGLAAARRLGDKRLEAQTFALRLLNHDMHDTALDQAREAIAIAEASSDPEVVVQMLNVSTFVIAGTHHVEEKKQNARRMLDLITENPQITPGYGPVGDHIGRAHAVLEDSYLALGDLRSFEHHLQLEAERAAQYPAPPLLFDLAFTRGQFALLQGRFDEHRELEAEIAVVSRQSQALLAGVQGFWREYEHGSLDDIAELAAAVVRHTPDDPAARSALALIQAESGETAGARATLDWDSFTVPAHGFASPTWPVIQHCLAVCAYRLDDEALASRTLDALGPHRDLVLRSPGALVVGAAGRSLGLCNLVLGEPHAAVAHLDRALRLEEGLGAVPHTVRTRVALANALDVADREPARAQELRAAAYEDATSLGMTAVIDELDTTPQN